LTDETHNAWISLFFTDLDQISTSVTNKANLVEKQIGLFYRVDLQFAMIKHDFVIGGQFQLSVPACLRDKNTQSLVSKIVSHLVTALCPVSFQLVLHFVLVWRLLMYGVNKILDNIITTAQQSKRSHF
jgi:hypothetical protein